MQVVNNNYGVSICMRKTCMAPHDSIPLSLQSVVCGTLYACGCLLSSSLTTTKTFSLVAILFMIRCPMIVLLGLHLVFLSVDVRINVRSIWLTFQSITALLVNPESSSLLSLVRMGLAEARLWHHAILDGCILFQIQLGKFSICKCPLEYCTRFSLSEQRL